MEGKWVKNECETCDGTGRVYDEDDKRIICEDCSGEGFTEKYIEGCPECSNGTVECDCTGGCGAKFADDDCPACGGTGTHVCPVCEGTGYDYREE